MRCIFLTVLVALQALPTQAEADPRTTPIQPHREAPSAISLDFERADVRNVLKFLAQLHGLNVVFTDGVSGKLSVQMKDVAPEAALSAVLGTASLFASQQGNILIVAPLSHPVF